MYVTGALTVMVMTPVILGVSVASARPLAFVVTATGLTLEMPKPTLAEVKVTV